MARVIESPGSAGARSDAERRGESIDDGPGTPDSRDAKPTLDERTGSRARPASSTPPATLPRYRFGIEIARGGMGRVVEATDTLLGRVVAVKEALATDPEALRRFARETRITARLEHPSIVPVHDAGRSPDGSPYYVMRKVSGRPLEDLVRAADGLEQRLALLPHLVAAAQAVAHAHQRGVVHRDLKPTNILVGDLGETVVIDWGLAKVIDEPDEVPPPAAEASDADDLRTRFGTVFGTPGFMSPEQLRGDPVDARSDVYALGATLYHLLAQQPPHASGSADDMMAAALAGPPTPIAAHVPGVPAELSTIVDKALAYDDAVRYPDAGALVEDLQRFLTGQLVASHRYSPRERLLRFVRKHRVPVIVSAAAAIALAIGAWIAIGRVIREKDRADTALREALERNEALTINQAQSLVASNPTAAVALLKTLPPERREVRMLATAARGAGVAWGLPAANRTASIEMSADGKRVLAGGTDGSLRVFDLATRRARELANVGPVTYAAWLDDERTVVTAHDRHVKIVDAATGVIRRVHALPANLRYLHASRRTAWWSDDNGRAWRVGVDDATPTPIPIDDELFDVRPSPDGNWVAWAGKHHLWVIDANHLDAPARAFGDDTVSSVAWADDSRRVGVAMRGRVLAIGFAGEPAIEIDEAGPQFMFAVVVRGDRIYAAAPETIGVTSPHKPTRVRRRVDQMVTAMQLGHRDTLVAATNTDKLIVLNDDLDIDLTLSAPVGAIGFIVASPRSPYVVASAEGLLLVWNLDDVLPTRLAIDRPVGMSMVGTNQMIVQYLEGDADWLDLETGERRALPKVIGPVVVRSPRAGNVATLTTIEHDSIVAFRDGRAPFRIARGIGVTLFIADDRVLYATDRDIGILDVTTRHKTPLATLANRVLLLAHRGTWIAARTDTGALWRRDLATGAEDTHPFERKPIASIVLAKDGAVYLVEDKRLRVWDRAGNVFEVIELHRPMGDLNAVDDDHLLVTSDDNAGYIVQLADRTLVSRVPTGSKLTSMQMTPEMTTAVDQTGSVIGLDLITGVKWTIGHGPDAFAFPQLSADGSRVAALSPFAVLVWSLAHPTEPADVARWLDALTNARAPAGPTALTWQ